MKHQPTRQGQTTTPICPTLFINCVGSFVLHSYPQHFVLHLPQLYTVADLDLPKAGEEGMSPRSAPDTVNASGLRGNSESN